MRFFIVLFLIFTSNFALASKVLVIVDGVAITSIDVQKRMEAMQLLYPGIPDDINTRKQILNNLISEELFCNEADRLKLKISDEQVIERLKEMQQENNYTDAQLKNFIANKSIFQQVKSQVLWNDLVSAVFYNKIKVSDAEIREEQKVHSKEIVSVDFKQIVFNNLDQTKIQKISAEAKNCSSFDSLSRAAGLGNPYHNKLLFKDLNPDLQALMKSLPVNKVSDVLQMHDFNQIVMICDKKIEERIIDAKIIKQRLTSKKINAEAQKYLAELKKRIYVEYINSLD